MAAGAVVEGLDVIEDRGAGVSPGGEAPTVNEFILQAAPERFHRGVIVAVAPAAHGGDEAVVGERGTIIGTGILHAAVGVMDKTGAGLALAQRHHQSGQRHRRVEGGAHGPADQAATATVEHASDVEPAFVGRHVSQIAHPDLVRLGRGRQRREPVGGNRMRVSAVGGAHAIPSPLSTPQAVLPHQASDAMPPHRFTLRAQFHRDPRAAIRFPRLLMHHGDLGAQFTIPARMRGVAGADPRVVTAARDAERRTQRLDGILAAHRLDPGIPLGGGSEQRSQPASKNASFFKRRLKSSTSFLITATNATLPPFPLARRR